MSDAVTVPPAQSAASEGRYATRTITYAGQEYTFSFYKGFASRVEFTPPGSSQPIEVYQQTGVFDCKDTGGPLADTTFTVTCPAQSLDVVLDIEDGPLSPPDYLGPIASIEIGLKRRSGTPAPPNPRVRPAKGADRISRLVVQERGKPNGGVHAFQTDDDGTIVVTNKAATCPPAC